MRSRVREDSHFTFGKGHPLEGSTIKVDAPFSGKDPATAELKQQQQQHPPTQQQQQHPAVTESSRGMPVIVSVDPSLRRLRLGSRSIMFLNLGTSVQVPRDSPTHIVLEDDCTPSVRVELDMRTIAAREQMLALVKSVRGKGPDSLRIHCVTWNVGDSPPPASADGQKLFAEGMDIFVVSLQECGKKKAEWISAIPKYASTVPMSDGAQGVVIVGSVSMWGIVLVILARESLQPLISRVRTDSTATGKFGVMGNKGGVALAFTIDNTTRIAFVGSHLAARAERVVERTNDYSKICSEIDVWGLDVDLLHSCDHVVWCGDLNYRIDVGSAGSPEEFNEVVRRSSGSDPGALARHDQLRAVLALGGPAGWQGFREAAISFPPTYRMERESQDYSNKRFQNPSYTDRILWRSSLAKCSQIKSLDYSSLPTLMGSDHRPVSATMEVSVIPPVTRVASILGSKSTRWIEICASDITFLPQSGFNDKVTEHVLRHSIVDEGFIDVAKELRDSICTAFMEADVKNSSGAYAERATRTISRQVAGTGAGVGARERKSSSRGGHGGNEIWEQCYPCS